MKFDYVDDYLKENKSEGHNAFNEKLIPGALPSIGVKIPKLRDIAKTIAKDDYREFVKEYPVIYYEHQLLKGFVLGYAKDDIENVLELLYDFIKNINDWAVCDGTCQTFKMCEKHREMFWDWLMQFKEGTEFEQRIVAVMLLSHYLVDDYIDKVLVVMDELKCDGYYTKMGVAWCVATAYAKYSDKTMRFLNRCNLDDWTYNKSIQKMIESYRVSDDDKKVLRTMKK